MATSGARLADGTPALTLDDSYIHLQYAWQTAQGHFLQYNTGDAPSTGATSLLYMLLLAGGFVLGISRQAMPAIALISGSTLFIISAALIADLACRLAQQSQCENSTIPAWGVGLLVGVLFAGSGWMAWAYLSGMETGLLIILVIGTLWGVMTHRMAVTAIFASLAALTRPEALLLGIAVLVAEWFVRNLQLNHNQRTQGLLWALMPLVAAAIPFGINYALTGTFGSTGLQAKWLLTLIPFYPAQIGSIIVGNISEITFRLLGGLSSDYHWHAFPLTQLLAAVGAVLMWRSGDPNAQRLALACLLWAVLGIGATATLQTAIWHHYRYQMPFYPAMLLPFAIALAWVAERTTGWLGQQSLIPVRAGLGLVVAIWCGYSLLDFRAVYVLDTSTIVMMQTKLAEWIRQNIPPGERIAAHDVGAIRYFGEHDTIDVVGLTTPLMASSYRNGPGASFEALESAQPEYYAIYPDTAPPYFPEWTDELIGEELYRVSLDPFSPYVSATGIQVITQPDWSSASLADSPHQPDILDRLERWMLVDTLDVADLVSEEAHDYHWSNSGEPSGFPSDVRKLVYRADPSVELADGGRLMTGSESFVVASHPGETLLLVGRFHQTSDMVLRVTINEHDAGLWKLPAIPGEWLESAFPVSANLISGDRTSVKIAVEEMLDPTPQARFSPYYYWIYQGGEVFRPPPQSVVASNVIFGEDIRLVGFDLPNRILKPGDALALTVYWQSITHSRTDLRVFVHLVDPTNPDTLEGIIAQIDAAPRRGTYPFWVWSDGEIVIDKLQIQTSTAIPAGDYLLLIGIYDSATGQRLTLSGEDNFGADRLLLQSITFK